MEFFIKSTNEKLLLEQPSFASGGEGALFRVLQPEHLQHLCAKLYHKNKRTSQKQEKIDYLYQHPLSYDTPFDQGAEPVIWIKRIIVDMRGDIVGFLMPFAFGEKLEILCTAKLPRRLSGNWKRFAPHKEGARLLRLKVCYNVASALRQLHLSGQFVLVDLKPDNLVVNVNGLVSIVDTDSVEVIEDGRCLYAATVATPEYTPPEYYRGIKPGKVCIENSWDRFSLAVILYKILLGVHPFAATSHPPYDQCNSLGDKIKMGLFVHHPDKKKCFKVVPPPQLDFFKLGDNIQQLFIRAFATGHLYPNKRPTAAEWCQAIQEHPFLITNRSPKSIRLEKVGFNSHHFFEQNLQKLLIQKNLVFQARDKEEVKRTNDFWAVVQQEYSITLSYALGKLISYFKITGSIVGFLLLMGLFSGLEYFKHTTYFFYLLPLEIIYFLTGFYGFVILISFPVLLASKNYFFKKNQSIHSRIKALQKKNVAVRKKGLDTLQFELYNKRTKLKEKIREAQHEIEVWSTIKQKREKKYLTNYQTLIFTTKDALSSEINQFKLRLKEQNKQVKDLISSEARALKECRNKMHILLQNQDMYGQMIGDTFSQKTTYLASSAQFTVEEQTLHTTALEHQKQQYEVEIKNIRQKFDHQHQTLQDLNKSEKIRIDTLLSQSTPTKELQKQISKTLINDSYKKVLITIKSLKEQLKKREQALMQLNQDIERVKNIL